MPPPFPKGPNILPCPPPVDNDSPTPSSIPSPTISALADTLPVQATDSTLGAYDQNSNRLFLLDSGAFTSIFPASPFVKSNTPPGRRFRAVNGTIINTYGRRQMPLRFNGSLFTHTFWLADVDTALVGSDFFKAHNLAIDFEKDQMVRLKEWAPMPGATRIPCTPLAGQFNGIKGLVPYIERTEDNPDAEDQQKCYDLLAQYPDLLVPHFHENVRHNAVHHIVTDGPPVHAKARRLDTAKLEAAKAEFKKMEDMGVLRRSNSPWLSPLHMVPKPDGSWRPCGDYKQLNAKTRPDKYPLPHIEDFTQYLRDCRVFSTIDIQRAFHHIPVAERDIQKTAIITPFGLYEWVRMPFGLNNAAQSFQRFIDLVLRDVPCAFVYLDDILVASLNWQTHTRDLELVFQQLQLHGITINAKKCNLGQRELRYLGHWVSPRGIEPLPEKVEAVQNFPTPATKKQIRQFLGLLGYYRRFCPGLATIEAPLHAATGGKATDTKVKWNDTLQEAFVSAKTLLAEATALVHPDPSLETALTTDASNYAIGAELAQKKDGVWRPVAFYSVGLKKPERSYPAFDRELLAVYKSIKKFRHALEGHPFTVYTDQAALASSLHDGKHRPPRQTNQLNFISQFTNDIRYIPSENNQSADALSRSLPDPDNPDPPEPATVAAIDYYEEPSLEEQVATAPPLSEFKIIKAEPVPNPPSPPPPLKQPEGSFPSSLLPLTEEEEDSWLNPTPPRAMTGPKVSAIFPASVPLAEIAAQQSPDEHNDCPGLQVAEHSFPCGTSLWCDTSMATPRPIVPRTLRFRVFKSFHGVSHPGYKPTARAISRHFVWKGLNKDVRAWSRACRGCQRGKVGRHTVTEPTKRTVPAKRFSEIHVDLVGPLVMSGDMKYLFTMIDRRTRWPEAVPLPNMLAATVARAFAGTWISRFGCPDDVTSDQGGQFTGHLWTQMNKMLGIKTKFTTAYHPQSNGLVERLHRRLKDGLRAQMEGAVDTWTDHLPAVLLGIRTSLRTDSEHTPAELLYGTNITLPAAAFGTEPNPNYTNMTADDRYYLTNLQNALAEMADTPTKHHASPRNIVYIPSDLATAKFVYLRRDQISPALTPPYDGPFEVVEAGPKTFKINKYGKIDLVTIDRLKPARQHADSEHVNDMPPAVVPRPPDAARVSTPAPPAASNLIVSYNLQNSV